MIDRGVRHSFLRRSAFAVALIALAGCAAPVPNATSTPGSGSTSSAPTSSAPASASPSSLAAPQPGQPFSTDDILNAMLESRRPGGVPDRLETREVASLVAGELWTIDGEPWRTITAGGSCGTDTCLLEVAGAAGGVAGEDAWVFQVDPDTGSVQVIEADLHALPPTLVDQLDAIVRAEGQRLELPMGDLLLTAARWLPPPGDGSFELSYRSGNEEGSCSVEAVVSPQRVELTPTDC